MTVRIPELAALKAGLVLDGEFVAVDAGAAGEAVNTAERDAGEAAFSTRSRSILAS